MPSVPPSHPDPRHVRRLVLPLAATVGVGFGAILYGFSVLITAPAAGGEFSTSVLSTAFSGSVVAGALLAVPVGRRADRHGIRGIVGLGGGLVGAGFAAFALATAPWQVLISWWLLIGPGSAMVLFDPAFVAIAQWFDRHDRNRAAGTLTLVTGLAGPIFVPTTTASVGLLGWRPTAGLLGALVLCVAWATAGLALRGAPPPPRPAPTAVAAPGSVPGGVPGRTAARRWPIGRSGSRRTRTGPLPVGFLALTGAIVGGLAALEAVQVHRIARFEATGFDPATLAFWAAAASLLSLPGRFLLPRLANRSSSVHLLLTVTVLLVPAVALSVRGSTTWEMVGHFVLFGALFGAVIPLRAVIMSDWFTGPRFGALMGIQAAAIAGGRAAGPAVVGWLADSPGGYPAGMAVLTGFLLCSIILLLVAADRRQRVMTHPPAGGEVPTGPG